MIEKNGNGADAASAAADDALKSAEELLAELSKSSELLKQAQDLIGEEKTKAEDFKVILCPVTRPCRFLLSAFVWRRHVNLVLWYHNYPVVFVLCFGKLAFYPNNTNIDNRLVSFSNP